MDTILDTYRTCLWVHGKHIVDVQKGAIIWKNVHLMFQKWTAVEHQLLLQEHQARDKLAKKLKLSKPHAKRHDQETEEWNNIPLLYRMEENYICPEESHWQQRYYKALFPENTPIKIICQQYYEGLDWVFQYYTSDCPDCRWKYDFSYPPLFSDLTLYEQSTKITCRTDISFLPVTSIEQLRYVLPPIHHFLIPDEMVNKEQNKEKIKASVPERLIFAYCRYLWEAHIQ